MGFGLFPLGCLWEVPLFYNESSMRNTGGWCEDTIRYQKHWAPRICQEKTPKARSIVVLDVVDHSSPNHTEVTATGNHEPKRAGMARHWNARKWRMNSNWEAIAIRLEAIAIMFQYVSIKETGTSLPFTQVLGASVHGIPLVLVSRLCKTLEGLDGL